MSIKSKCSDRLFDIEGQVLGDDLFYIGFDVRQSICRIHYKACRFGQHLTTSQGGHRRVKNREVLSRHGAALNEASENSGGPIDRVARCAFEYLFYQYSVVISRAGDGAFGHRRGRVYDRFEDYHGNLGRSAVALTPLKACSRRSDIAQSDEGRAVARHRAPDGFQTGDGGVENLAAIERPKSVAESRERDKLQKRNRSHVRNQIRRLIHAVTQNPV